MYISEIFHNLNIFKIFVLFPLHFYNTLIENFSVILTVVYQQFCYCIHYFFLILY